MTGKLTSLLLLAPALLGVAGPEPTVDPPKRKLSLGEVLEPNSVLTGVMLPRYDKQLRLTSVLRAKTVTLVSKEVLDGEAVQVRLYQPDRSTRGTIALARARLDQETGKISGSGETLLVFDRTTTTASGLVFRMDDSRGFLTGPVVTRITPRPKTAMNHRVSPLRAAVLLGTALAAQPLAGESATAAPAPAAAPVPGNDPAARAALSAALEASAAATAAAAAFLEQEQLLAQNSPAAAALPHVAKPLDMKVGEDDTVISCEGGSFFDGEKGILTYQGNVTVRDPRGSMDGANDLQAFFAKKPPARTVKPEAKPEAKPGDGNNPLAGMLKDDEWELDKVVATGAVHLVVKGKPGDDPIEAGGAIFTYHARSGTITITGGQPWARQGGLINRAKQANQTITISMEKKTAVFSPGGTETIAPVKDLQNKNKQAKPKP